MTDIDKLKDALIAAKNEERIAHDRTIAAGIALQDAINAESGVIGHVLQFSVTRGWGNSAKKSTKRILVDRVAFGWKGELKAHGKYIIAGGEIGVMRGEVVISEAADLGMHPTITHTGTTQ